MFRDVALRKGLAQPQAFVYVCVVVVFKIFFFSFPPENFQPALGPLAGETGSGSE